MGPLISSAALLDFAVPPRERPCAAHEPERRPDLDDGAELLAFVCKRCGVIGFRAFATPQHAISWKRTRPFSRLDQEGRDRLEQEKKATRLGWRP